MNAYLQIGSALLIVAAGASWPLYRVMQENAGLQQQVDRSLSVEGAALAARQAMVAAAAALATMATNR